MIDFSSYTDIGEKERNEDTIKVAVNKEQSVCGFILADGLGGHGNGEIASRFVVDITSNAIEETNGITDLFIDQCFDQAQEQLMEEKARTGYEFIKTTMVMLLITSSGIAQWGHIGDSRLYLFRKKKLILRTLDHSVPQMLVLGGQIKEKEIRRHPDRSTLLRAMGVEWDAPMYEIGERKWKIRKGDTFLLCSDGFWEWIEEKSMIKLINRYKTARESLQAMADTAKASGKGHGMDNLSAILIQFR